MLKKCISNVTALCTDDGNDPIKQHWTKALVGFNILCTDKFEGNIIFYNPVIVMLPDIKDYY